MVENIKIEISETNRGKEQLIINRKYKYNFSKLKKDNSKVYRCTEYKTLNKCKSFININDNKDILEYESEHNHLEKEFDASVSITKHKIKEEIRKSSIPMDLKPKHIYNEVSQEMGFICPEYNSIRSQIIRKINKQLPPDVTTFDEIPEESEYYKTERGENFMIFKNTNLVIFQSPFQAELFGKYYKDVFVDGTFYIAPKFSYQVFITRAYVSSFNKFYTTSVSILKNKEQATYEILFYELQKNARKFSNTGATPTNLHCDFEIGISNAAKKIFPDINIRFCVWHFKRSLEKQKNKICYSEVDKNDDIYTYYKAISNLPFINPEYIFDVYVKIAFLSKKNKYDNFSVFLEYFKVNYLHKYDVNDWNYYNNIEHITNNSSESYNNYLNNLFPKKPSFYKLIIILKKEESLSYNDFKNTKNGINRKKPKLKCKTDLIKDLIESYKNDEKELESTDREGFVKLWYRCLIDLNNKKYQ